MFYSDYLDYWMKEYFEINYKYSTVKRYKELLAYYPELLNEMNNRSLSIWKLIAEKTKKEMIE